MSKPGLFNFEKPETITEWLIFLAATGIILSSPYGARRFISELCTYIFERREDARKAKRFETSKMSQAIYRLKKRKMIKVRELNGKTCIELTEKGTRRKLLYDMQHIKISKPEKWDSKWRFLMFDIPETKRTARQMLTGRLKYLGFFQFQKSVWAYPYPCENEIDFISELFGVAKYVTMITVQMENDKPLKHAFNL